MNETVEVRLRPSAAHTVVAVVGCVGLFIGGIFVGRATKTDGDPQPAPAVIGNAAGQDSSLPGEPVRNAATELLPRELFARPNTEVLGAVEEDGPNSEPRITVELLESSIDDIDLSSIEFEAGSADLTPDGQRIVNQIAEALLATPFIPVEIQVSTFSEATPGINHGLSQQRAEAIVTALTNDGVSASRLSSIGLGSRAESPLHEGAIVLFSADDPDLARELRQIDQIALEYDREISLTTDGQGTIAKIGQLLAEHAEAQLTLVGYGYGSSPRTSHDLSHRAIDVAADALTSSGINPERLDTVGLGDAPLNLQMDSRVELKVGTPAGISLALQQVDGEVTFLSGTSTITSPSETIAEIASAINLDDDLLIELSMHTYTEPSSQRNHDLSRLQGEALVDALIAEGVDPQRLHMVAHGDPPHFARPGRETLVTFFTLA